MLALDDPCWNELRHAYGDAADIPKLLQALASLTTLQAEEQEELWSDLWSRLCHQDDVYNASYAAVPHIVRIANEAKGPIDVSFFTLPAAVEIARQAGRGPEISMALAEAYHRAIELLAENASLHRHQPWDRSMVLSVAAAQAVAKGHVDVAEALLNLDDDWIARINDDERD